MSYNPSQKLNFTTGHYALWTSFWRCRAVYPVRRFVCYGWTTILEASLQSYWFADWNKVKNITLFSAYSLVWLCQRLGQWTVWKKCESTVYHSMPEPQAHNAFPTCLLFQHNYKEMGNIPFLLLTNHNVSLYYTETTSSISINYNQQATA